MQQLIVRIMERNNKENQQHQQWKFKKFHILLD